MGSLESSLGPEIGYNPLCHPGDCVLLSVLAVPRVKAQRDPDGSAKHLVIRGSPRALFLIHCMRDACGSQLQLHILSSHKTLCCIDSIPKRGDGARRHTALRTTLPQHVQQLVAHIGHRSRPA